MKKSTYLFFAVLLAIFTIGAGRSRYSPYYWVFDAGGIKYTGGNVDITNGIIGQGTDVYVAIRTVIKTISVADAGSTDDFQFTSVANVTEQNIDLGEIIPAYAEILSAQFRCFETVDGSGSKVMSIDIGTTSGSAQISATVDTDAADDISGTGAGVAPITVQSNTAKHIWVNATPTANWNTLTAGRWAMLVTYIDYGAVYTAKNP